MSRSAEEIRAWKPILDADLSVPPGGGCPTAEDLLASAHGEASSVVEEKVLDHVAACGACAAAWRVGREMKLAEGGAVARPRPRVRAGWWLLAAAALVVTVLVPAIVRQMQPRAPVLRAPEQITIRAISGSSLPRDRFVLRWEGPPKGSRFDVSVTTLDLEPVFSVSGLDKEEVQVPASRLESLAAGSGLYWRVTARLPDGRSVPSITFTTRLE